MRYEHGRVSVHNAHKLDVSSCFFQGELSDVQELVKRITSAIRREKLFSYSEIALSLPEYMVSHKIVQVKNAKQKDLGKHLKQHNISGRFNSMTYVTDWAYLGKQERNEETILFCMLASVSKAHVFPILDEFAKRKLKIACVSFPTYNLTCLSELHSGDYEHPGRIMLDFGQAATRVTVWYEEATVYTREIGMGFQTFVDGLFKAFGNIGIPEIVEILTSSDRENTALPAGVHNTSAFFDLADKLISDWQNEIIRIIQMCGEDGMPITKIVCASAVPNNMLTLFEDSGVVTEQFRLTKPISGNGYTVLSAANTEIGAHYGNAVGFAVNTMQ